jgi:predicted DNA-binding transcriptional regulator AlpA
MDDTNNDMTLVDARYVARVLGISVGAVRHWTYGVRPAPTGWPPPVRVGGRVRYRLRDLRAYIDDLPVVQPGGETT